MNIQYDAEARAMYLRLERGEVTRTERIDPRVLIDLDANGQVLGIELLGVDAIEQVPASQLRSESRVAEASSANTRRSDGELADEGESGKETVNMQSSHVHSELGASFDRLFDELAEEAEVYSKLLDELKRTPIGDPLRDDLEGELYGSLAHLATHAALLLEAIDQPDDEANAAE